MAEKQQGGSSGQQPEALRSLDAAAKAGSRKPDDQGLQATGKTAPRPDSLEEEQRKAAEVLKEGAERASKAKPQG